MERSGERRVGAGPWEIGLTRLYLLIIADTYGQSGAGRRRAIWILTSG